MEFTRGLGNMPWHCREFVVKDCDCLRRGPVEDGLQPSALGLGSPLATAFRFLATALHSRWSVMWPNACHPTIVKSREDTRPAGL